MLCSSLFLCLLFVSTLECWICEVRDYFSFNVLSPGPSRTYDILAALEEYMLNIEWTKVFIMALTLIPYIISKKNLKSMLLLSLWLFILKYCYWIRYNIYRILKSFSSVTCFQILFSASPCTVIHLPPLYSHVPHDMNLTCTSIIALIKWAITSQKRKYQELRELGVLWGLNGKSEQDGING